MSRLRARWIENAAPLDGLKFDQEAATCTMEISRIHNEIMNLKMQSASHWNAGSNGG